MSDPRVAHGPTPSAAVFGAVSFVHVADVERSLTFYGLLGFARSDDLQHDGRTVWAEAMSGAARMMFAQAGPTPDPDAQAVLFYMYSRDVAALREHLLASGVHDGGEYCGQPGPNNGRCVAFAIHPRDYMPAGELRLHDPDGYVILVGQPS